MILISNEWRKHISGIRFLRRSADCRGFWNSGGGGGGGGCFFFFFFLENLTLECIKTAVFDTRNPKSPYRWRGPALLPHLPPARSVRSLAKLSSSFFKYFLSHPWYIHVCFDMSWPRISETWAPPPPPHLHMQKILIMWYKETSTNRVWMIFIAFGYQETRDGAVWMVCHAISL